MAANTSSSSFSYADFTPVKPRKNRKNRPQRTAPPISPPAIDALRAQLRADEWFAQCSHLIEREWTAKMSELSSSSPATSARVRCLGLGSPSASPIARIQLAFLAELCNLLDIMPDAISLYDPVFSADDTALFSALNMHVLPWDSSAPEYALDDKTPTLWFMPHCDMELYEALLRANWTHKLLKNCIILGNQLQEYIDNKPTSVLQAKAPCLLRAAPLFQSHLLPPSSAWPTAFNNTAVQVIKVKLSDKTSKSSPIAPIAATPGSNSSTRPPRLSASDSSNGVSAARGPTSAGPQPDPEEALEPEASDDNGLVPMDAYMAIFDKEPWLPQPPDTARTPVSDVPSKAETQPEATDVQTATAPSKAPQAPQE